MTMTTTNLGSRDDEHTVASLLLHTVQRWPRSGLRYAVGDDVSDVNQQAYPVLLDVASRILGGLRAHDIAPGERVVVVAEQPQDFVQGFWACVLGGYVPCPLTPLRGDPARWVAQLAYVHELIGSRVAVATKALQTEMPAVDGCTVLSVDELSTAPAETAFHPAGPDDLALLMLTSGSTGHSKAVALTHRNLVAAMAAKAERLRVTEQDVTLNWVSFDHIAGVETHLLPLSVGARQVLVEPQAIMSSPIRFLEAIDAHRVTTTFTPNFLFGLINKEVAGRVAELGLDLSPLRIVISGGEATVRATAQTFIEQLSPLGLSPGVVHPGFGMTETCAGSIFSLDFPEADAGREFASVGEPIRGLEMRVVDSDEAFLPEGEVGELQLRGPMVFAQYYNNAAATKAAFTEEGWFRTGDRGEISQGRLTVAGRSKDSIIVNGVSYYSHDLESVLEQLDGVEKAAAFPTRPPGSDTEQLVVAFVPTVPLDDEAGVHRLLVAVRNSAILHWGFRPATILPLPASMLPRTSLGKIQRSVLQQRLETGELAAHQAWVAEFTARQLGGYVEPEGEVEEALARTYADMFGLDPSTVSSTASFFDLGGTSLDILQLKNRVQERFRIPEVPVITLLRSPTVSALARQLSDLQAGDGSAYDPLVPLQTSGTKTPLFCVHPGVGEVLVFVNLAKYFVNERPFYGLRARGFGEGEDYFTDFDEMVQTYVRAIRAEQPTGPYAIAGYSYGGVVAFEIAKALEAEGERVDFVGVFNIPPHIQGRMHELDFAEGAVNLAFFLSLVTKDEAARLPDTLRGMSEEEQLASLVDVARPERLAQLDLDLGKFAAWVRLAQSLVELGRTYEPSGVVKSLSVFYAIPLRGTKEDWLANHLRKWDDFAREPNSYIDVPGEHYTLMGPDNVAAFQALLRAEVDRALDGN